jgi:predicted HAD superfamily phosphohydrolase YqeG
MKGVNNMLPKGILFDLDDTIISYSSVADPDRIIHYIAELIG